MNSRLQGFRSRAAKRRNILTQGASPGFDGPHPAFPLTSLREAEQRRSLGTPLPLERAKGREEGRCLNLICQRQNVVLAPCRGSAFLNMRADMTKRLTFFLPVP